MSNVVLSRSVRVARSVNSNNAIIETIPTFDTTNQVEDLLIGQSVEYGLNRSSQPIQRLSDAGAIEGFVTVSQGSSLGFQMNFIENAHDFVLEAVLGQNLQQGYQALSTTDFIRFPPDVSGITSDPKLVVLDLSVGGAVANFLKGDQIKPGVILLININLWRNLATPNKLELWDNRRCIVRGFNADKSRIMLTLIDEVVENGVVKQGSALQSGTGATEGLRTDVGTPGAPFNSLAREATGGYIAYKYLRHDNILQLYSLLISMGTSTAPNIITATDNAAHTLVTNCVSNQVTMNFTTQDLITFDTAFTGTNVYERNANSTSTPAVAPFVTSATHFRTSNADSLNVKATGSGGKRIYIDNKFIDTPVLTDFNLDINRALIEKPTIGQLTPGFVGSGNLTPTINYGTTLVDNDQARELALLDTYHSFTFMNGYRAAGTTSAGVDSSRLVDSDATLRTLTRNRMFHVTMPNGSYQFQGLSIAPNDTVDLSISVTGVAAASPTGPGKDEQPKFTEKRALQISFI